MTEIKKGDKVKLPGEDEFCKVQNVTQTYLEIKEPLELCGPKDTEIVFSTQTGWVMQISEKGIEFNQKERPRWTANDFAREVCYILEKNFNVKFTEVFSDTNN